MGQKLETLKKLLYEMDSKKNVFQEQPEPLSVDEKRAFMESLKQFSQLGESVYGRNNLEEITERLNHMVETATRLVSESGDITEKIGGSRHMKYINEAMKEFKKSAQEVVIHERRMSAAYEDIAEGLKKYYDID
jgi:hypothetical protein